MNDTIYYIGEALKKARQEKGISQAALAKSAGIPQSHLSKIERGLVNLQVATLIELARALDLEVTILPPLLLHQIKNLMSSSPMEQKPLYQLKDADEE